VSGEGEGDGALVYKRPWNAPVWRGSLAELIEASETVVDELRKTASRKVETISIRLEFRDSEQTFSSLAGLEETGGRCDPATIAGFHFDVKGADTYSVKISGDARTGMRVIATGSEIFANGMESALKARLSGGVEAGERAAHVPADAGDVAAGVLVAAAAIAVGALCLSRGLDLAVSVLFALATLGVGTQTAHATVWAKRAERRRLPAFEVVEEGRQFPDDTATPNGLLWRAKKWLDRHPGLAPALYLTAGALLHRLAQEISF
jgi:hypothetical protein